MALIEVWKRRDERQRPSRALNDAMEVLSRVKRFPFSRKDEASVSKYLQALGAKTTKDAVCRIALYSGPKLSGKTSVLLANAAGDFIMADTVAGAVRSISDGFSGLRFDFEKAEDDVWFVDPPLKQLAHMAESEGMSADDLIERLDAAKNSLRHYQGFGDEGDEINEGKPLHLRTATRAKGKEFDMGILLDVNENMWPYKRAETPRDIAAERRLCRAPATPGCARCSRIFWPTRTPPFPSAR